MGAALVQYEETNGEKLIVSNLNQNFHNIIFFIISYLFCHRQKRHIK